MTGLTEHQIFTDNGTDKRERENFRNNLFENVQVCGNSRPFSFYRSDFRGAHFTDCSFKNTIFDMSDFIDTSFYKSEFNNVNWGSSEIKNCYFENVIFNSNIYETSIQKSVFRNCNFSHENFKATVFNVTFENCSFYDCDFESSTFEDINFINTTFKDCEMSTMHAENFSFEHCNLDNVIWGIEYWFTYFIYDSKFENIKLKYRGLYVDISRDNALFTSILLDTKKRNCFFEYFNILILQQIFLINNSEINIYNHVKEYPHAFDILLHGENELHRKKQILSIFKLIQFYFFRDNFNLYNVMCILEYINSLVLDHLTQSEAILYRSEIYKINEIFIELPFSYKQILSLPHDYMISADIRVNYEEFQDAKKFLDDTFEMLTKILHIENEKPYEIIKTRKGSWEFEIMSAAFLIIALFKIIKGSINFAIETKLRIELSSMVLKGLKENSNKNKYQLEETTKAINILQNTGMLNSENFSPEIMKADDLSKFMSLGINLHNKKYIRED